MGPTWGPPGADRTQMGPMLAPWILLSGLIQMVKLISSHDSSNKISQLTIILLQAADWYGVCNILTFKYWPHIYKMHTLSSLGWEVTWHVHLAVLGYQLVQLRRSNDSVPPLLTSWQNGQKHLTKSCGTSNVKSCKSIETFLFHILYAKSCLVFRSSQ